MQVHSSPIAALRHRAPAQWISRGRDSARRGGPALPAGAAPGLHPTDLHFLQRTAGNHAVATILAGAARSVPVQRLRPQTPLGVLQREPYASSVRLQAAASGRGAVRAGEPDAAAVRAIQQGLAADGFGLGVSNRGLDFDGIFGGETTSRVRLFQRKHGVDDDGTVGPVTLRVLDGLAGSVPVSGGDPALTVTGKRESPIGENQVFFERLSSTVDAFERARIATRLKRERDSGAKPPPDGVIDRLSGFASVDEADALAAARVRAVEQVIEEIQPGRLARLATPDHRVERERADQRQARRVDLGLRIELEPIPEDPIPVPSSTSGCDETRLAAARTAAVTLAEETAATVGGLPADPAARRGSDEGALYEQLFSSFPPAHVQKRLLQIADQLGRYTGDRIRCHASNDDLCGAGTLAVNHGVGADARMGVCPQAVATDPGALETIGVLLHEAVHGTPEIRGGTDHAYLHERMFASLTPAEAERNPDHYRVLATNLRKKGTLSLGPQLPDTFVGFDPATGSRAATRIERALAFLERDLRDGADSVTQVYPFLADNDDLGTGTVPAAARAVRRRLGLPAQPGAVDPAGLAAVAGAADRYRESLRTVSGPIDVRHTDTPEKWSAAFGAVLPGVQVNDALAALPLDQRITTLTTRLFQASPGIAPIRVPGMVLLLGDLRAVRGRAAPKGLE